MSLEGFVKRWTVLWPYDSWFRRKYKIAFNSSQHRELTQIDIKFEYIEDRLAEKEFKKYEEEKKLKDKQIKKNEKDLFDQIKI